MDIITDLTAQAVSFLTVIQDLCKDRISGKDYPKYEKEKLWTLKKEFTQVKDFCSSSFSNKMPEPPQFLGSIRDIIWYTPTEHSDVVVAKQFFDTVEKLLSWLEEDCAAYNPYLNNAQYSEGTLFCTPYQWRKIIRFILYKKPERRTKLAEILCYMPVQVILCLAKTKLNGYNQRLCQVWSTGNQYSMIGKDDKDFYESWWEFKKEGQDTTGRISKAIKLLEDDALLLRTLSEQKIAIPFETFFNSELDEICRCRNLRINDNPGGMEGTPGEEVLATGKTKDPFERARNMELHGLALSGGGIRSATFNLGVLQKLAQENRLTRFDYLSTVSGGGYIGAWFASWIKRSGSEAKVVDRLNIKKSADPLGEEVRPIRWLRMFSNYLAPKSSLMSADSWTMGITWLRNTLINQIILLLLLCTALAVVSDCYDFWKYLTGRFTRANVHQIGFISLLLFSPAVVMAGFGMRAFEHTPKPKSLFMFGTNRFLSVFLVCWAVGCAYFISAWLFHPPHFQRIVSVHKDSFSHKVSLLLGAALAGFIAMVVIAYLGYYQVFANKRWNRFYAHLAILGSSALAAFAGLYSMAGAWTVLQGLQAIKAFPSLSELNYKADFILGTPLILEVISVCVVVRMALMGNLFPDERREWWGRMGALVHRYILLWLLISVGALILPEEFDDLSCNFPTINIPAIFGGWGAIIGFAVNLAYHAKEKKGDADNKLAIAKDLFIKLSPYLFMLGFLLLGAYVLSYINQICAALAKTQNRLPICLLTTLIMGAVTAFLSWRVGVNEFSLHHFYRNRLVRAYMGATRKRTDRDKTANNFTGFDKEDDIRLAEFTAESAKPYGGPYPIINATLNASTVTELDRQDRNAESFIFSPLYCGFDFSPTRSGAYAKHQVFEYGYRPTNVFAYENGPMIGTAMSISGAALSPNMGYHSSSATAFLLTMFNVRLGWWMGNPRLNTYNRSDPDFGVAYLVSDLIGKSDIESQFVCLSDGGHFDNMGLYELIRRRCKHVTLCDAEEDPDATCEGLANAIRRCRIDFGVYINLDTKGITDKNKDTGFCTTHRAEGTITYPGDIEPSGTILYIKTALTGTEPADIREYHMNNHEFPQQPTSDQFFTEEQFESYRLLGYYAADAAQ